MLAFSLGFLGLRALMELGGSPVAQLVALGVGAAVAVARRDARVVCAALGGVLAICVQSGPVTPVSPASFGVVKVEGRIASVWGGEGATWSLGLHGGLRLRWIDAPVRPGVGDEVAGVARLDGETRRLVARGRALELARAPAWRLEAVIARVREWASARLGRGVPERAASLARSLLLGERGLPEDLRARLRDTGALHFFAVSGFHLALLAALAMRVVGPRNPALLIVLLVYALATGMRSPVARAMLVASLMLGASWGARRASSLSVLAFAATIVLALEPDALHTIGFQLSFAAYAGILFLAVPCFARPFELPRMGTLPRAGRALAETLLVTTGAFATSAIPLCWHFQALSVGSFAASLLLLPIMPVLMLASLGQLAIPDLGIWALLIDGAMIALEGVVGLIDRLPGTPIRMGRPTPLAICMAVLVFGLLAWRLPRQRPEHRRRLFLTGSALAVLACFVNRTPEPGFRLLDVGHGLALLVSTDRGGHGLVDTGPGAEQAARQVRELGLKELDWVLITHDHRDHDGGLPGLARSLAIRRFHGVTEETALFRGDRIAGGRRVLWPPRGQPRGDENDRSVVVKLSAGGGRLLVTGDLESRGTRALLDCGDDLSCEVLLLPHHGAANEALTDLVLRAAPAELWIAGRESFVSPRTRLTLAWLGRDARTIRDGAGASWPSTSQLPKHESE